MVLILRQIISVGLIRNLTNHNCLKVKIDNKKLMERNGLWLLRRSRQKPLTIIL